MCFQFHRRDPSGCNKNLKKKIRWIFTGSEPEIDILTVQSFFHDNECVHGQGQHQYCDNCYGY